MSPMPSAAAASPGKPLRLDASLALVDVIEVARGARRVELSDAARQRILRGRAVVDDLVASGDTAYGINTGFGELASVRVPADKLRTLQVNLLRSHAIGTGDPLPPDVVRAMLLLRAHSLTAGFSGVRAEVVEALLGLLNTGVTPVVPARGSLGASGDLIPLAHLALVLIGEGEADHGGVRMPGGEALSRAGLTPLVLAEKEGLALINGTQYMTAYGALLVHDVEGLMNSAECAAALSVEALKASRVPFDEAISRVRRHPGQIATAARMRALLDDSDIARSHAACPKVQDPYSLRCIPQVLGASRDVLTFVRGVIEREIDAVTDNPLCFPAGEAGETARILSGGNFHGQLLALALDALTMAVAEVGSIAERRIYRLLDPHTSGLPAFLAVDPGLDSGLMLAQYQAAALVAESRILCHPASVDSIPTSAGQEDHVSMGATAAYKARQVCDNTVLIVAIEFLCAAQGLEYQRPLTTSAPLEAAWQRVRELSAALTGDRALSDDLARLAAAVRDGELRGT